MKNRTIDDRINAASKLDSLDDLPGPLLADSIDDSASRAYGSFPDRLYIVYKGKIAYQGGVGPHGYVVRNLSLSRSLKIHKINLSFNRNFPITQG